MRQDREEEAEPELESSSYFLVTFFLPAMARRGPFLVRALV
jgi:hypothetical protein